MEKPSDGGAKMEKGFILMFIFSIIFNILGVGLVVKRYFVNKSVEKTLAVPSIVEQPIQVTPIWLHKVSQFDVLDKFCNDKDIVFLGDSLTERFLINEFNPDLSILNRGISGDTTDGLLKRIDKLLLNCKPSKLFMMIGINDMAKGKSFSNILTNYNTLLLNITKESQNTHIYIQSVLPIGKSKDAISKEDISNFNNDLQNIANQFDNLTYIDIASSLKDQEGYLDELYTQDEVHLNGKAYKVWNDLIQQYLVSL